FLYNKIPKNWAGAILAHMIESKRKNKILSYAELITEIPNYTDYPFVEEEPIIDHIKIGQPSISKMRFTIKQGEFVA
ncbi:hypothetical protein RYX36_034786, partial [Vicia faba]